MTKRVFTIAIGFTSIIYLAKAVLTQLNEFGDSAVPLNEIVTVESIGRYDRPFRVDYLSGQSKILGQTIVVPVLPEVAENTRVGARTPVVIGKGLLHKRWVTLKETHQAKTMGFKIVYIGLFVGIFSVMTLVYVRSLRTLLSSKVGVSYSLAVAIGTVWFYMSEGLP